MPTVSLRAAAAPKVSKAPCCSGKVSAMKVAATQKATTTARANAAKGKIAAKKAPAKKAGAKKAAAKKAKPCRVCGKYAAKLAKIKAKPKK